MLQKLGHYILRVKILELGAQNDLLEKSASSTTYLSGDFNKHAYSLIFVVLCLVKLQLREYEVYKYK